MAEEILAPLSGKISQIHLQAAAPVEEDDEIMAIEAMKMETLVYAPCSGKITELRVKVGDDVEEDTVLVLIEPA